MTDDDTTGRLPTERSLEQQIEDLTHYAETADKALERKQRHIESLQATVKEQRSDNERLMEEIQCLHMEYVREDCDGCGGSCEIDDVEVMNYPSAHDPYQPAEKAVRVPCPDCMGTGKEWMT